MSDINSGSPYEKIKNDRTKINNLTGYGTPPTQKKFCYVCSVALRLREADGITQWWCHSCNNTTPLDPDISVETANAKYTSRYGSTGKSNFFIISQKKKKTGLDESEKEEIRKTLGSDGVTVVNSKDSTYDTNSGWSG